MNRYYLPLLALLGCAGIAYATGSITVTGYPPVPRTIKGGTGINISADGTVTATGEAVSIGSQPFQNISTALHGKFLPLAGTAVNSADAQAYKGNSAPSGTEFSYLQGVTSAIQTQLNGKADTSGLSTVATTGSYTDLANKPTIPSALSELSGDSTHQVVTDAEKAAWTGKQAALGFTPENAANKGAVNGYPSLDSGGKIPTAQIPTLNQNTTGTSAGLTAAYIDWSLSSGGASIKNKPNLSTVATSGNYSDLSGKPAPYTLPTASTIVKGGVMVDGSSIQIDGGGVIHSTVSAGVSEVNGQTGEVSLDINDIVGFDGYSTAVNSKLAQKVDAANPVVSGPITTSEPDGKHRLNVRNTVTRTYTPAEGDLDTDANGTIWIYKSGQWVDKTYVLPAATASTLGGVKPGTALSVDGNGVLSVMLNSLGPSGLVTAGLAGDQTVSSGFAYVATATPWKATFNSYSSTKQTTIYAFGNYSGTLAAATGSKLYWSNPVTFALQSSASAKLKAGTRATVQMSGGKTLVAANQNLQKIVVAPPAPPPVTTGFSDDFTGTDGTALATHDSQWASPGATYPVTGFVLNGGNVRTTGTFTLAGAYHTTSTSDVSQVTLKALTNTAQSVEKSVAVRMDSTTAGYRGFLTFSGGNWTGAGFKKNTAGFGTCAGLNFSAGTDHTLRIEASGTSSVVLTLFVDNTQVCTATDFTSPYAAGHPGFTVSGNGTLGNNALDNWRDHSE